MSDRDWFQFQEEICTYFQSLGFESLTNVTVDGVRSTHNIDVTVKARFMGQKLFWIIEAKKWKARVTKNHVMALRSIVGDCGADKGFVISERGFQKGAYEAADKSNVSLLSLDELKAITREFVENDVLTFYVERMKMIYKRYWSHSKQVRRNYGLRDELGECHYSISFVLRTAADAIIVARRREYPISLETSLVERYGQNFADNFQQLLNWMNLNLNIIDRKILDAEIQMQIDGTFNPKYTTGDVDEFGVWQL